MKSTTCGVVLTLLAAVVFCGGVLAQATATVTISGAETTVSGGWDTGALGIVFGDSLGHHYTETIPYARFSTPNSLAADFGAVFTRDYISASGLGAHASGATITFQLNNGASLESLSVYNPSVSFTLSGTGWPSGSATTLSLSCAASSLAPGQTTSCTAQVTPTAATGIVSFTVSSSATGSEENWQNAGLNGSGSATASDGFGDSSPGTYTVIASYDGNSSYSPSSASYVVTVNSSGGGSWPTLYSYSITGAGGASGYEANGNVQSYSDSVTGTWTNIAYDNLDRLVAAAQTPPGGSVQYTCWGIDDFGNHLSRTVSAAQCNVGDPPPPTTYYNVGSSNQIQSTNAPGVPVSYVYDAAGNVLNDGVNQYLYDGEGRLCAEMSPPAVSGGPSLMTQYIYDAEGNRVAKGSITTWSAGCNTALNGFTTTNSYVLGAGGEQLTEMTVSSGVSTWAHTNVSAAGEIIATYDADPTGDTAGTLHFHLSDWLGTRRVQTDYAGNTEETCSSLSYGDQLNCTLTSVPTALDATEHHFTGKERDAESGNDYFGARYYASSMGRWMSPDPKQPNIKHLFNPQKWNKYNYVLNNPLSNIDPDGLEEITVQLRAYIPQAHQGPYRGDNRGPTTSQNVTSRTSITVRVETDPTKNGGNPLVSNSGGQAGTTHNDWTGASATQTVGLPTATVTRDSNGNVVVGIKQDAANPLTPQGATPGIKSDLNVTIPQDASSVTTAGTVSGSPAFELNIGTEGGANINVPLQGASNNPVAFGAGLTQTNPVLNSTPLPPPPPQCAAGGSCPH